MTSAQFSDTRSRYPRARQRVTQRQDKQRRNLHRPAPKVCVKRCDVCFPKSERTERIRQHRRRLLNKGRVLRMSFAGACVSVVQGTVPVTASTRLAHPRVQRAQNHQPWPQCRGAGRSRRCKVEPRADKDDVMCASIQASRGSWNTGRRDCFCTLSPIAVGRVHGTINRSIINASAAFSRFLIPDWHPAPALLRPNSCPSTPRPRAG